MASIQWETDYATALARATSEHTFVFLDVFNPG